MLSNHDVTCIFTDLGFTSKVGLLSIVSTYNCFESATRLQRKYPAVKIPTYLFELTYIAYTGSEIRQWTCCEVLENTHIMGQAVETGSQKPASLPPDVLVTSAANDFAIQSEKLSLAKSLGPEDPNSVAVEARFVTPDDAVIVTADGNRLPIVPLQEAYKLNALRDELSNEVLEERGTDVDAETELVTQSRRNEAKSTTKILFRSPLHEKDEASQETIGDLKRSHPPSHTNPLFPPLPLYGPPSLLRKLQCWTFRFTSFFLSAAFLAVIVQGALFTSLPVVCSSIWQRLTFRNPNASRPFHEEEVRRSITRKEQERLWERRRSSSRGNDGQECPLSNDGFVPTEGGPDPIICDVGYYARRVGLDVEEFQVQTEDGFVIDLWHVYDPREYTKLDDADRSHRGPDPFTGGSKKRIKDTAKKPKFPVLLMHGLLQSAGAYCVNDDDSLAFYLCKSGYDVVSNSSTIFLFLFKRVFGL